MKIPNDAFITQISCGANYTLMLTKDGKVLGMGDSSKGQLGYYNTLAFTSLREIEQSKTSDIKLSNIKNIQAGYEHVVALDNNGAVWTWGGTAGTDFKFTDIKQMTFAQEETIQEIKSGNGYSLVLSKSGNVYRWSANNTSATNRAAQVDLSTAYGWDYTTGTPKQVFISGGIQVRTDEEKENIAIINKTYYVISKDNKVYSWGVNTAGQTGTGDVSSSEEDLTELQFETNSVINKEIDKVTSSAVPGRSYAGTDGASYDTAYAINSDGYVLGWGYAGKDVLAEDYKEGNNTFKLLGDGTRYVANYIGSIGIKSITGKDISMQVGETSDLISMIKDGGYVTGGRVNLYRTETQDALDSLKIEIDNEEIASYDAKTGLITGLKMGKTVATISSERNFVKINIKVSDPNYKTDPKIISYDNYTIALKSDGTVWAWGYNDYLGITDASQTSKRVATPTQIKGIDSVMDIAVGDDFVLLLMQDGTVWGWGRNQIRTTWKWN